MIDDYAYTMELVRKMKAQLPIPALPTQAFIQLMHTNGIEVSPGYNLQIESVLYMGDEGGIGCAIKIAGQEEKAIITSLTHIRIEAGHPLAEEILAYQIGRTQRLSQMDIGCIPTQFTLKPRRKGKKRRKR